MSKIIASRYARALFEITEEAGTSDPVRFDLQELMMLCEQSREFIRLLRDPLIPIAERRLALTACLKGKVHAQTLTYLHFLAQKKRLALLPTICSVYADMYLDARGLLPAVIESNIALSKVQLNKIQERFHTLTGKEIVPELRVDATMLGGFRVRIRNEIYDHTIESKLRKFRRAIVNH